MHVDIMWEATDVKIYQLAGYVPRVGYHGD